MTDIHKRRTKARNYYAAALLLTACYPHSFVIWQVLSQSLNDKVSAALPIVITTVTVAATLVLFVKKMNPRAISQWPWPYLIGGVLVAILGVLATDPGFPAKRIHIPQYIVLALIVQRALSFDLPIRAVLPATLLLTSLLGVHDELMQGLHAQRTFGIRDIGVNSLGALSGALLGVGFYAANTPNHSELPKLVGSTYISLAILSLGTILMVWPLENLRDAPIPLWTLAPITAAGVSIGLLYWRRPMALVRPTLIIATVFLSTPIYVLLSYAPIFIFH